MKYPATFDAAPEGGYIVTFRDIPEAITQGDDEQEALAMARDGLLTAMDFYFEDHRPVPPPSAALPGERMVGLPLSVSAKVILLNALISQNVRPIELARRMGVKPQEVTRLLNLKHATKIDTVAHALQMIGLGLQLAPAAYTPVFNGQTTTFISKVNRALKKNLPDDQLVGRKNGGRITVRNAYAPHDVLVVDAWVGFCGEGELSFYFQDGALDVGFNYLPFKSVKEQWLAEAETA